MLNIQKSYSPSISAPSGFTLMELMTIVSIIAILAAIALPSYRQYTVKNAESQAQAKMRQLQIELDSWRANALTYKGFQPKRVASNGTISYTYDTVSGPTPNTQILVPDATNPRYTITLLDGGTANTSLVPTSNSTTTVDLTSINPNGWRMVAVPNTTLAGYGASNIILTSKGLACKSKTSMTSTITTCPTGATVW